MSGDRSPFDNPNPFRLTEAQRKRLSDTLMLQKPPDEQSMATFAELVRRQKRLSSLPIDVLFTLEALRLLADQGNIVAQELYWSERVRLGIDIPKHVQMP